jgi:hypothetical protein
MAHHLGFGNLWQWRRFRREGCGRQQVGDGGNVDIALGQMGAAATFLRKFEQKRRRLQITHGSCKPRML